MKKTEKSRLILLLIFTIISIQNSFSQKIDTIGVSYNKTVVLIFENPIIADDIGSENVIISRDREVLKIAATIKAFQETTLFVETKDGYYSFILVYDENPKKLSHLYKANQVTIEKLVKNNSSVKEEHRQSSNEPQQRSIIDENSLYKDCQAIAEKPNTIHDIGVIGAKVSFMLGDIYINNDQLYFKIVIKNNSQIDYDVEMIRFSIKSKKGTIKQAAVQETIIEPDYVYNSSINEIKGKEGVIKVFVFRKFTYSADKRLNIELWENGGERILHFQVPADKILNVKRL